MLLRFGVENFRSIRDYQELSFIASPISDSWVDLLTNECVTEKVLPAIGIYGSNASGKSSVIKSLNYFLRVIRSSHQRSNPGEKFSQRVPFALDPSYASKPTLFDCDFILEGTRYHYGFSMDETKILSEWLFAFSRGESRTARKRLYYRDASLNEPISFGKALKGLNRTVEELTRNDSLFLSSAAQNNHKQLTPVYEYFTRKFNFRDADSVVTSGSLVNYIKNEAIRAQILEFLQLADTGITNAEIVDTQIPEDARPFINEFKVLIAKQFKQDELSDKFSEELEKETRSELKITHQGQSNDAVKFSLNEESSGTIAILGLLGPVFDTLNDGGLLIVDELNTNLHPHVSKHIIKLFSSKSTNLNSGQLLFATHDTNLLCPGVLRRDQVWFTEKDGEGATHLYPLTDIKTRPTDNIERGYLEGRFGAIPYFNDHLIDIYLND